MAGWLAGWLAGRFAGRLAGRPARWLAGSLACLHSAPVPVSEAGLRAVRLPDGSQLIIIDIIILVLVLWLILLLLGITVNN